MAQPNSINPRERPCVLIVDDDPAIRTFCNDLLSGEGYDIAEAANGREALVQAGRERIRLILMDLTMPELDGVQTCELLKADPRTEGIPVVMMSAQTNLRARLEAVACLTAAILPKPFDLDQLLDIVEQFTG